MIEALNVPAVDPAGAAPGQLEAAAKPRAQRRRPLRRGQHSVGAGRGGRRRRRSRSAMPPWSASPSARRPSSPARSQEINFNPYWYVPKTIIYKDLVPKGREFARRGQDLLARLPHAGLRRRRQSDRRRARSIGTAPRSTTISSASFPGRRTRSASSRSISRTRTRLHARHAAQEPVRPGRALRKLGLRARAQCRHAGRRGSCAIRPAGTISRIMSMKQTRRADRREAHQAGPGLFRLYQRLGHA